MDRSYLINSFDNKAPRDGAPLRLQCSKRHGMTLLEVRGLFNKTAIARYNPLDAELVKSGCGKFNAWTGKRHGDWDVYLRHSGGLTTFQMRNKGDALALIKWVKKNSLSGR